MSNYYRSSGPNKHYNRAVQWLNDNRPFIVSLLGHLGAPVESTALPTAWVSFKDNNITLRDPALFMNPDFFSNLKDDEAAFALAHETYHILLDHLVYAADQNKYPNTKAFLYATESTINDLLFNLGYTVLPDVITGVKELGVDFSGLSLDESYALYVDHFAAPQDADSTQQQNGEDSEQDNSGDAQNSGGNANGSGDGDSDSENGAGGSGQGTGGSRSSEDSADKAGDTENADSSESTGDSGASGGANGTESGQNTQGNDGSGDGIDSTKSATEGGIGDGSESGKDDNPGDIAGACGHMFSNITKEQAEAIQGAILNGMKDAMDNGSVSEDDLPEQDDLSGKMNEMIEDIKMSDAFTQNGGKGSGNSSGSRVEVNSFEALSAPWEEILKVVNPDIGKKGEVPSLASYRRDWGSPSRRFDQLSRKNVVLPSMRQVDNSRNKENGGIKPFVLIAMDFSGSIDPKLQKALAAIAVAIPGNLIEYEAVTFSTYVKPFNPKSNKNTVAEGGTNFLCVHKRALELEKKRGIYPYVINLTDGYAGFDNYIAPNREQIENWLFVDIASGYYGDGPVSKPFSQADYYVNTWAPSGVEVKKFSMPLTGAVR